MSIGLRTPARANLVAILAWMALVLTISGLTWDRIAAVRNGRVMIHHTNLVLETIKNLEIAVCDAETGQRGYLLTGEDAYRAPYDRAVRAFGPLQGSLRRLTIDNPVQQQRLRALAPRLDGKLAELAETIRVRHDSGLDAALAMVRTDLGLRDMIAIKSTLQAMSGEEQSLLGARMKTAARRSLSLSVLAAAGAAASVLALIWAARRINRAWARAMAMEHEQRRLAERLIACLDSLSQGVAVFDADHLLTNRNDCFRVLLDLPGEAVRPGAAYAELVRSLPAESLETGEQIRLGAQQTAASRGGAVTREQVMPDGQHLEIRRTAMPDGGFVLTISDLTKRVQAEALLREAQKMQAIGQLTGGIAHDFNNLLTVILGNLELAQKKLSEDHVLQSRLGRAVWAAQRGATLTAQLLAFARKQPLAPAPIDLSRDVPDLLPLLQRTLGAPVDVRFLVASGLWLAMADSAQFESALLNLALNARDAMPDGGRLTLELANKVLDEEYARAHYEVTAGEYVMLAVSDTGTGMTPQVAARVFEPFFTTKPEGKGTGLGLAMVFGFVKQSKGHVKIYSEPGEGTTVRIYLPRATERVADAPTPAPAAIPARRACEDTTVLVVEDEAGVRDVAVGILHEYGYHVLEAADGETAIGLFDQNAAEIDLLLTDVVLPGRLRGRDVADHIARIRPEVRVLFMSGYTENSIVHHGRLDAGVQLIGKPFHREQLAARVAEILGSDTVTSVP